MTEINDELTLRRGLNVGGAMRVKGDTAIEGDLRIGGWLDVRNVKGVLKGLFATAARLERAYPFPRDGWMALVGDTLPAPVYRAEGRRWIATGETGGGPQLELESVLDRIAAETQQRKEADTALSGRIEQLEPLSGRMETVETGLDTLGKITTLAVETEELEVEKGKYFNFRGVKEGDIYRQVKPEMTSEAGFTAASRSFSADSRRALVLTARGNDMVRGYAALDEEMRVLRIASDQERVFDGTFIELPRNTRYLLTESYGVGLQATVYGESLSDDPEETDVFHRRKELEIRKGECYDYGQYGDVGDIFDESHIGAVASIPTSQIALAEWKKNYTLKVTMNTGTPNVWGICYIDSDNVIIGRETPFRQQLKERQLFPPDGTSRIVFQTYDPELFPMDIRLEYNILDVIAKVESEGTGGQGTLPLAGKRMVILGDSISCRRDAAGKTLADYLAMLTGAEITNCSVGGARLSRRRAIAGAADFSERETALAAFDVPSIAESLVADDATVQTQAAATLKTSGARFTEVLDDLKNASLAAADIALVFAGTNDYTSGVDHRKAGGDDTIQGAVATIAGTLCRGCPKLLVIFCTPLPRRLDADDASTFSDTYESPSYPSTLPQISATIAEEARKWHFPVIDLYNTIGWNRHNYMAMCNPSDGTHPVRGLKRLASAIAAGIASYVT